MAICCPPEQTRADPQGGAALRGAEATRLGDGLPLAHTQPESKASGLQLQSTPQTCPSSPPHRPHPSLLPPPREAAVASSLAFLPQPCGLFPHDPTEPKFVQVPPPRTAPPVPPHSEQRPKPSERPRGPTGLPFFCLSPLTRSAPASQLVPRCEAGPTAEPLHLLVPLPGALSPRSPQLSSAWCRSAERPPRPAATSVHFCCADLLHGHAHQLLHGIILPGSICPCLR